MFYKSERDYANKDSDNVYMGINKYNNISSKNKLYKSI